MKASRLFITFLTLALGLLSTATTQGAPSFVLVEPDGPNAEIFTVKDAPPPVTFAAEELQDHVRLMSGQRLKIVHQLPADQSTSVIVLGDTRATRKAGIDPSNYPRDQYTLRLKNNRLFVVGKDDTTGKSKILQALDHPLPKSPSKDQRYMRYAQARWDFDRGTLNGTYRLLELLGVRWFFPGPKGRVVPQSKRVALTLDKPITKKPSYKLAVIGSYSQDGHRLSDPRDKKEYKALDWSGEKNLRWILRMRQPNQWLAFNHRPPRHLWVKRFAKSHPEYFALRKDGRRDLPPVSKRNHLCYTNDGVFKQTVSDIGAFWDGKTAQAQGLPVREDRPYTNNRGWSTKATYKNSFSLLPQDSFLACQGDQCATLIDDNLPSWYKHSRLIWHFVDRVARAVKDQYPDHYLTCLAYSSYTGVPSDMEALPDNVIVGICPNRLNKVHNTVNRKNYKKYLKLVRDWDAMNDMPLIIWGHHLYRHHQPRHQGVPMLLPHHQREMFGDLAPHAQWMYMQEDRDSPVMEHINRYMMSRLAWDPDLDVDRVLDDYAKSFYGDAASRMRDLFREIENQSKAIAATDAGRTAIWEDHYSKARLKQYARTLAQARQATTDSRVRQRIDLIDRFILGRMKAGRADYVRNVKEVRNSKDATCTIRLKRGPLTIDGKLDEKAWDASMKMPFYNNITGEKTKVPSRIRLLRSPKYVYFGFICYDPNAKDRYEAGKPMGSVEVFLDPQHNHDSYYQLMVDLNTGRITTEQYYQGGGEQPVPWKSKAKVAVDHGNRRTMVEIRLPRSTMDGAEVIHPQHPWGANFCRTFPNTPRDQDKFSSFSPMMKGSFHQPDLFGHIVLRK